MEIGARPIVNGVGVVLVIVLVNGNETGELVGSLPFRVRLGVLRGVAVVSFPNGMTFAEVSVDELFKIAAYGRVSPVGVLVEVEIDAFGEFAFVIRHLELGNHALIGIDLKLIVVGHAARDLRNDDGDETRTRRAQKTRDGQHVAATVSVVGHAGSESPIRHIADGVHHAPDEVHDGHRRKVIAAKPPGEAGYQGRKHNIVMPATGRAIHLR